MPRSPSTYSLPPGTTPQQPNTVISSSMFNAFADDVAQTFNTVQPIVYGGTGSNDLKLTDTDFGIKDNGDPTKIGQFNASNLPTATTRTYDLPYYSGTLGLVSDIRGQIYGLTLSNNVTDATNDIDIAAGSAVDSTGVVSMLLASSLTKRLDAAWAVGTGNGWLDTGAIANTTYHVFLIRRPDTGVVDSLASTSPTAPTLPANYTQFRRIGAILRVSGAIVAFSQNGDEFILGTPVLDVNANNPGTSAVTRTLSVPSGIVTTALLNVTVENQGGADYFAIYLSALSSADVAPAVQGFITVGAAKLGAPDGSRFIAAQAEIKANASRQIRSRAGFSDASCNLYIGTRGWIDTRGRNA